MIITIKFKTIITYYDFKLKFKVIVGDNDFDNLKKNIKIIVTSYNFMTGTDTHTGETQ